MISIGQKVPIRFRYRVARMVYHYAKACGAGRFRAGCDALVTFFKGDL